MHHFRALVLEVIEGSLTVAQIAPLDALGRIFDLGQTHALTPYGAVYLDLAMTRGLPLATNDDDLRRAAPRVGVPLVEVGV
jgi:predicted nucleic acid-binding protein